MRKFAMLLTALAIILLPAAARSQSAAGDWWGLLEVAPGSKFRVAVQIVAGPDGNMGGTLDSPEANLVGMVLTDVVLSGDRLEFRLKTYPGRFVGSWNAAAKAWRGTWSQGGQSWPLVLAAGKPPASAPTPPVAPDPTLSALSAYAKPDLLVDVGGRRINLRCQGAGGPAVILMSGNGQFSLDWYAVHPTIAKRVRTCAWDRAGFGHSDPAPLPQNPTETVADLHAALTAAKIAGPYILVGASLAGLEARLFAQRWPDEVAGMVLVDSSFANQRAVQASLPGFAARSVTPILLNCIEMMARPGFGPATPNYNQCVPPAAPGLPADLVAAWPKFFRPSMWASTITLTESLATPELETADRLDLGDKPLVVLTAGKFGGNPKTAEFDQAFRKIWLERQQGFARMSSRGVHIVVPDSAHFIQGEKPDAVIDAVNQVLDKVGK